MSLDLKTIETEFQTVKEIYEKGEKNLDLVFQGHTVCGRFLKYLIQEYYHPMEQVDKEEKEYVLEKSKSLRKLLNFMEINMKFKMPRNKENFLCASDSFYIAKTFENDDCLSWFREEDLEFVMKAMEFCSEFVKEKIA